MTLLTHEDFAPHATETFTVRLNDGDLDFVLQRVETYPYAAPMGERAPFSLFFHHQAVLVIPQQTYPFRHPRLGNFDMFVVPVARDAQGFVYQAVFN